MKTTPATAPRIATEKEWLAARLDLLRREKECLRLRDELSAARRQLPWVPVGLVDLFDGCSQLVIYHFMLAQNTPLQYQSENERP
jgi:predicted dithiol-disulfide oxidoreductase (DUF899 family)